MWGNFSPKGRQRRATRPQATPRVTSHQSRVTRMALQNVSRQILVLHQLAKVLVDVGGVDRDLRSGTVGGFVRDRFEQAFEHGVQAAGTGWFSVRSFT